MTGMPRENLEAIEDSFVSSNLPINPGIIKNEREHGSDELCHEVDVTNVTTSANTQVSKFSF